MLENEIKIHPSLIAVHSLFLHTSVKNMINFLWNVACPLAKYRCSSHVRNWPTLHSCKTYNSYRPLQDIESLIYEFRIKYHTTYLWKFITKTFKTEKVAMYYEVFETSETIHLDNWTSDTHFNTLLGDINTECANIILQFSDHCFC